MLVITLIMVAIVVVAALVVTYVAYPHRGEDVPSAPWLGEAMTRAADAVPTLPTEGDHVGDNGETLDFRSGAGSRRAS